MPVLEETAERLVLQAAPWNGWRRIAIAAALGCVVFAIWAYFDRVWLGVLFGVLFAAWQSLDPAFAPVVTVALDRPTNRVRVVERGLFGRRVWKGPLENLLRAEWVEACETKFVFRDWLPQTSFGRFHYTLFPTGFDLTAGIVEHAHEVVLVMKADSPRVVFGQFVSDADKRDALSAVERFLAASGEAC